MDSNMFCYQCEQTVGGKGCTRAGVCGKTFDVANLQDKLTGALVSLALNAEYSDQNCALMERGLFATVTNVDFSAESIQELIDQVHAANPKGAASDFDTTTIWTSDDADVRSLKSLILFGVRGMAAYAYHARALGYTDENVDKFFFAAMQAIGKPGTVDTLLPVALEVGKQNLTCMGLLDKANTETYGNPEPTEVSMEVGPGPFIIVTGHDLHDLDLLLQQTDGTGVNVYTHGEMLPTLAYPKLKAHPQLKGNFGSAWQNQQKEFDGVPAPILFTTNCLMPPKASYADRVYTSDMVHFDGTHHIGEGKDFSELIARAKELGGYDAPHQTYGENGGTHVTTGYARNTILSAAPAIVNAVKGGKISHFFLIGGCDGRHGDRDYYTQLAKETPKDSVILTLGCGKYRFNDLDLGTVAGLPRVLDMGQCNDAYGAIQVAVALAKAFDCEVNDLPLTIVLSWFEQKAVSVLLTLLSLGITNIKLGPTLPAFVSENVLNLLVENYHLGPTSTPEKDLAEAMA